MHNGDTTDSDTENTDDSDRRGGPSKRAPRPPRKTSETSLMNSAVYYLQRFSASRDDVRRVLERRAQRSRYVHGGEAEEHSAWIKTVLDTLERQGFLNDAAFAEARARSLAARGTASRMIRVKLARKGVSEDHIDDALHRLAEEIGDAGADNPDLTAAVAYARRRRLGPWRSDPEIRSEKRDRDLAALARQGFSGDVARKVIDAEDLFALEDEAGRV